jgi:polyhydroxybutyrate depolymerase
MKPRFPIRIPRWIKGCSLVILIPILLCGLLYGGIYVASSTGRQSIVVDGVERKYRTHLPAGYDGSLPTPLVLAFHMYGGNARMMEWLTHFNQVADENGFIVVYPEGYKNSWADGSELFPADLDYIDDVAFTLALIDELKGQYNLDETRIYATGFSNGGFFAQRLACEATEHLAAIATVGASLASNTLGACAPEGSIPVLMINGTDDPSVNWDGSPEYAPVPLTAAFWAAFNSCDEQPNVAQLPDLTDDGTHVRQELYSGCRDEVEVILDAIEGGGHAWPMGNQAVQLWGLFNGRISQQIDASRVIWDFFKGYRRVPEMP